MRNKDLIQEMSFPDRILTCLMPCAKGVRPIYRAMIIDYHYISGIGQEKSRR
jgi:hypothetical protein